MNRLGLQIKVAMPIAAITFVVAAVFQLRAQFWATGAICILLAIFCFVFSIRQLEKTTLSPEDLATLRPFTWKVILWAIIASLLNISTVYVADNVKSAATDRFAEIAWIISLLLSLLIIWHKKFNSSFIKSFAQTVSNHRIEVILLSLIITTAFALRTVDLTSHPYPWSGDEASIGIEARRIRSGEVTNYFETGWSSQPNWSFVPTSLAEILFGENILAVRLTSVIAGTLAVLFLYLTAREFFDPAIALMAGAILATLPYHVHFSRIGVNNVIDSFMSSLLFWLLARGYRKADARLFFTAGLVGGLCIYTYAGTRLVLILGSVAILYFVLRQKDYLRTRWQEIVAFGVGVILSAAPQAAFFAQHRDIFMGRFGQEGIFLNGWLTQQATQTGKSAAEILFNQFTRTILVFIASPAPGNFFNSPNPYLTIFGSILFILGMCYALIYLFEPKYFIPLLWFWSVILFGGVLTLNPPANTRLLMTTPVVALFTALGASKVLEYLQRFGILPQRFIPFLMALTILILSYQNVSFYMGEYKNNYYFQDANGEYAMEASLMTKGLDSSFQIYVMGAPRVFSGFPTFNFLAPNNPRVDLTPDNLSSLILSPAQKAIFFATPENQPLLAQVMAQFPGGKEGLVYRKPKPSEVLFEYYVLRSYP